VCIAADPAYSTEIRGRRGAAIAARKRALTEWDRANTGTVYDPGLFRRGILPRLRTVPLPEIMETAGCSEASTRLPAREADAARVDVAVLADLVGAPVTTTQVPIA
jgi:hypothetical protein